MVKFGVLFEVRTEFLNFIYSSFGFRGLSTWMGKHGYIMCSDLNTVSLVTGLTLQKGICYVALYTAARIRKRAL
jgi:hypothetical protein